MKRLLLIAAAACVLATPAAARPVMPDDGGQLAPQPFDTQPWFVDGILTATVNQDGSVTLTDDTGAPVRSPKPGVYSIWIRDWSQTADFHLTGTGVDVASPLSFTGYDAWRVPLLGGDFRFFSDSDPAGGGTFNVDGYRW